MALFPMKTDTETANELGKARQRRWQFLLGHAGGRVEGERARVRFREGGGVGLRPERTLGVASVFEALEVASGLVGVVKRTPTSVYASCVGPSTARLGGKKDIASFSISNTQKGARPLFFALSPSGSTMSWGHSPDKPVWRDGDLPDERDTLVKDDNRTILLLNKLFRMVAYTVRRFPLISFEHGTPFRAFSGPAVLAQIATLVTAIRG
jgi:hypothetical protein